MIDSPVERLLEFDFPVASVSEACVAEKSVRHGHVSTLQQWFARRPLAVCRATIFAALIDEPEQLDLSPELRTRLADAAGSDGDLGAQLTRFAARLAQWTASRDQELLALARDLLAASRRQHALVVDTYAGGGSVPIEALRLGLRSHASDLHPVATTALRLALDALPGRPRLVNRYRELATLVADRLHEPLARWYGGERGPQLLAEFWARTCTCPSCGGQMPLVRTWWLAHGRRPVVARPYSDGRGSWRVELGPPGASGDTTEEGTASGRGAICIHCKHRVTTAQIRTEGMAGRLGELPYARLECNGDDRVYRVSDEHDLARLEELPTGTPELLHDMAFDLNGIRHVWAMQYGLTKVSDLHNPRQLAALGATAKALAEVRDELAPIDADADALTIALTLTLNRLIPYSTRCTWWQPAGEFPANMFSRQAVPMVWNYVEIPIISPAAGGWRSATVWLSRVFEHCVDLPRAGTVRTGDAASTSIQSGSADLFVLDPPYFDAVAYSYLADPFYAWNRNLLQPVSGSDFEPAIPDRSSEAIVDRRHSLAPDPKDGEHFRQRLTEGFGEARRCLRDDGRLVVMYGHPRLEAWEAMIEAILTAGFSVVRSWPIHTERKVKFRHSRINALSTSAVLVCRKRPPTETGAKTLEDFEHRLGAHLDGWLSEFEGTNVLGSDLQAAIAASAAPLICADRMVDARGESVPTSTLLAAIPRLLERRALDGRGASAIPPELRDVLAAWVDDKSVSWLTLTERHPLLDTAITLSRCLQAGSGAEADELWGTLPVGVPEAVTEVLGFIAATATAAADRRAAETVLGRVSLYRRRALGNHRVRYGGIRPQSATAALNPCRSLVATPDAESWATSSE